MMFPNLYAILRANSTVLSMAGDRIGRHGSVPQGTVPPYITWSTVGDAPHNTLSESPESDFNTVQIDCYTGPDDTGDAQAATLARAVRDALDAAGHHNRVIIDLREPDTKLFRVGIQSDLITQR